MRLYLPFLVLYVGFLGNVGEGAKKVDDDLAALCAGMKIDLVRITQLASLAEKIANNEGGFKCHESLTQAITELDKLIKEGASSGDVCTPGYIESFKNFYLKYLDRSQKEKFMQRRVDLPIPLKKIAIAYGMQISNACKRRMVDVLNNQASKTLDKEDYEPLSPLIGENGIISDFLGSVGKPDDIFLPTDLALIFKAGISGGKSEKLYIQAQTDQVITGVQIVCKRRFKPIYDSLMMPMIQLAKFGFNYRSSELKLLFKDVGVAAKVGSWARIVFLCEALSEIELINVPNGDQGRSTTEAMIVRILTKGEADAFKAESNVVPNDKEIFGRFVKQLEFVPESKGVVNIDEILPKSDKRLYRAVVSFKTTSTELDHLRVQLKDRGLAILKSEMKQYHFRVFLSASYEALMQKMKLSKTPLDTRMELVKSINEIVEQQMKPENSVAWTDDELLDQYQLRWMRENMPSQKRKGDVVPSKAIIVIAILFVICCIVYWLMHGGYAFIMAHFG